MTEEEKKLLERSVKLAEQQLLYTQALLEEQRKQTELMNKQLKTLDLIYRYGG